MMNVIPVGAMKNSARHIELLDYIRAIAILTVMLDHTLTSVYGFETLPWKGLFRNFSGPLTLVTFLPLNLGQTGVAIFFFVSGFCIHLSFQQQGQKWSSFFIRRFFRIYPAYLAAVLLFTLFIMVQPHMTQQTLMRYTLEVPQSMPSFWNQVWTHLFLVHNFQRITFAGITAAFWSLAIEAQLYLLYPLLLWLVVRRNWRGALFILAVGEILIRGADGIFQTAGMTNTVGGIVSGFFTRSPFGYWFSWALGAFVADAFLKGRPLPFLKISIVPWIGLSVLCYLLRPLSPFCFTMSALLTAMVAVKFLNGFKLEIKGAERPLNLVKKIGLWSYSIYLIHQPLLNTYTDDIIAMVPQKYLSVPVTSVLLLTAWLIIIPFSVLWYKVFELPGIALGKGIIKKMDAPNAAGFEPQRIRENAMTKRAVFCAMIFGLLVLAAGSLWVHAQTKPLVITNTGEEHRSDSQTGITVNK